VKSLLPPRLRTGDRIGIAAPGGPVRPADLEKGMEYLSGRGFALVRGRHLGARHGYLAGTDAERLEDLNRLLADRTIAAIWFARGGYGTARIVAGIDLAALKKHPKALIGYSDLTVLHAAAYKRLRLSTLYGPLVKELGDASSFDDASLWQALSGDGRDVEHRLEAAGVFRPGSAEGPLVGGCLSLLVSLVDTPYEVATDGAILFWEEVGEEPYRIDRMLGHLRMSGRLARLKGMVVGRLVGCEAKDPENALPLAEILSTHLEGTSYPVVVDFPAGHCPGKVTLPLGRLARLDTAAGRLTIQEG
jgi:muramoyltetrapeptide carboxypeptidase